MSYSIPGFRFKLPSDIKIDAIAAGVYGNGLLPVSDKTSGALAATNGDVVESSPAAMSVDVKDFCATSDGNTVGNVKLDDAVVKTLAIPTADPTNPRMDRIVLEFETDPAETKKLEKGKLTVIAGTPAADPVPPALGNENQIHLAYVTVAASVSQINTADINKLQKDWVKTLDQLRQMAVDGMLANDAAVTFNHLIDVSAVGVGGAGIDLQLKIGDTDGTPNIFREDFNYLTIDASGDGADTPVINDSSASEKVLIGPGGIVGFNLKDANVEEVTLSISGTAPLNLILGNSLRITDTQDITFV